MWGILFLLFIAFMIPSSYGFLTSDRPAHVVDKGITNAKVTAKNAHFWDSFNAWFRGQKAKGNGSYVNNADQEQTHEYIGVKIEGIEPWKEEFYTTEPVYVDIDYSANSYFPIKISTTCKTDESGYGDVDKPVTDVSSSQANRVRCTFKNLPKGSYVVDVISAYSYQSTARIPLKFMEKSFVNTLLAISKDSGNSITAESYVGGTENPLTNSGPLAFGASNVKVDGVSKLKMPIEINKTNMNENPSRIRIQIQQQEAKGKITKVNNISFNVPAGMFLKDCDFLKKGNNDLDNSVKLKDRWIYTVNSGFGNWGDLKTISCAIEFDESYKDYFLPRELRWSPQTIFFTMNYLYKLEQSSIVKVVA